MYKFSIFPYLPTTPFQKDYMYIYQILYYPLQRTVRSGVFIEGDYCTYKIVVLILNMEKNIDSKMKLYEKNY